MTTTERIANLAKTAANLLTADELEAFKADMENETRGASEEAKIEHGTYLLRHLIAWRGRE